MQAKERCQQSLLQYRSCLRALILSRLHSRSDTLKIDEEISAGRVTTARALYRRHGGSAWKIESLQPVVVSLNLNYRPGHTDLSYSILWRVFYAASIATSGLAWVLSSRASDRWRDDSVSRSGAIISLRQKWLLNFSRSIRNTSKLIEARFLTNLRARRN